MYRYWLYKVLIGTFSVSSCIFISSFFTNDASAFILSPSQVRYIKGAPSVNKRKSCPTLQSNLYKLIAPFSEKWSITVINKNGTLIADINGQVPRIPASNQKLISTSFALDKLGPTFRLQTKLYLLSDGSFALLGQGDPDLDISKLRRISLAALNYSKSNNLIDGHIKLILVGTSRNLWWPPDWESADRKESYGAPVTRLALMSNAIDKAVPEPLEKIKSIMSQEFSNFDTFSTIKILNESENPLNFQGSKLIHTESSAPMNALLSLANAESHNFTAEVLLRVASNYWNTKKATSILKMWLSDQNLPTRGVNISDGSGLSRSNKATSQLLAELLMYMHYHRYSQFFESSMAIVGFRGTLLNLYNVPSLLGKFYGKTGTLDGVRSVSGILNSQSNPLYISIVVENSNKAEKTIQELLTIISKSNSCYEL